jgi:LemA protein
MDQSALTITLGVCTALILIVFYTLFRAYNRLVTLKSQVEQDFSDIDIQLKRRSSLINNLVNIVKSYAKHEKETFTQVAQARAAIGKSASPAEAAKADKNLSESMMSLFAIVERYPELKASQNYQQLRNDLVNTENLIAQYREQYNVSVMEYNNRVLTFPSLLTAKIFGFSQVAYYRSTEAI